MRSARHGTRWLIAGAIGVLAVIALVGTMLLANRGGPTLASSYVPRARRAISPVLQANRKLASSLSTLSARTDPATARSAVKDAIGTTQSARRSLGRLHPTAADRAFASDAAEALALELAWLNAADSVLRNSQSPMLNQLSSLGAQAQAKLQAIDDEVPGASSSFPGSAKLVSYAQARTHAANSATAMRQFSDQVQSLLTQSAPAYQQINRLFREMQTAASGGTPTITLAEAESVLTSVISNRTALAASARALSAPTAQAASVRAALVAAMDASLANDHDISTCLNQANTGTVAFIFQECLSSTSASSNAATAAKQRFVMLYNQLRSQIGQPATSPEF